MKKDIAVRLNVSNVNLKRGKKRRGKDNCSRHKAKSESCLPINCSKVSTHLFSSTCLSSNKDIVKKEKNDEEEKN